MNKKIKKLLLYEAVYSNKRDIKKQQSSSAFFYAENDEQAFNFASIIEDEMCGRKLKSVELSEIKMKPTHDYKLLLDKEIEIKMIGIEN